MNQHPFFSDRRVVILLASFCCLLWGSSYPAIKNGYAMFGIAASDIPSKMVFAGYRFAFAGLLLLALVALTRRGALVLNRRSLISTCLLGLTQTTIHYVFFYIGLAYTTGVKSSVLNGTVSFFGVLLAHFIYRNDRLSVNKILGCLIGFAGVMAVNFGAGPLDFNFTLLGEGFVVIAAFILSASTIYGKRLSQNMDSVAMTGYQLGIGGALLLLGGYASGGVLGAVSLKAFMLLAYLVLLSSLAIAFWAVLLKYNRVAMVSVFNFLVPIFGAVLSALFLGESVMELKNLIALVLVCAGIWLVNREKPLRVRRESPVAISDSSVSPHHRVLRGSNRRKLS